MLNLIIQHAIGESTVKKHDKMTSENVFDLPSIQSVAHKTETEVIKDIKKSWNDILRLKKLDVADTIESAQEEKPQLAWYYSKQQKTSKNKKQPF